MRRFNTLTTELLPVIYRKIAFLDLCRVHPAVKPSMKTCGHVNLH